MINKHCYVRFEISSAEQMERLAHVITELQRDKESGNFRPDYQWKRFFSADELKSFWTPSDAEREDWKRRWDATPVPDRFTDPSLQTPWDFGSMIDANLGGEYSLIGLRSEQPNIGLLEFAPAAYPFGGTGCLRALILAYGHKLVGYEDGTGFIEATTA